MSRYPGAAWRGPVPNFASGGNHPRLFVMHIMEGSLDGCDSWFHNPAAQVSANFGNGKDGRLFQWVDTADTAWAQASYNGVAVSVEHEGNTGDSLTAAQLENDAHLLAWAHTVHGIPLQVTNDPNGSGVIGHGLLGVAGGNHPDCPGSPILAQRQAVVDRAKAILNPVPVPSLPKENEMILLKGFNGAAVAVWDGGTFLHAVQDGTSANGYGAAMGTAVITPADYAALQAEIAARLAALETTVTMTDAQAKLIGDEIAAKLPTHVTGTQTTTVDETLA